MSGSNDIRQRNTFLIEEQAAPLRAAYGFDVRAPETQTTLMHCREERLGRLTRLFRFSSYSRTTPFNMCVRDTEGRQIVRLTRGVPVVVSRVRVLDAGDALIGTLRQHAFSVSGIFDVLDATDNPLCRLRGRATRTEFTLCTPDDVELARITKRWAGLGKELLTSADHYELVIDPVVPPDLTLRQLILAAAISIGLLVKFELP